MSERIVPSPVGPSAAFYRYLAQGELRLQRCGECGAWRHPPRYRCAACGSPDYTWEQASGNGRVFSWTITHRAVDPAFTPPYAIVVVELDEGPRLVANLRNMEPADLALDVPVTVEIEAVNNDVGLLWFTPRA